MRRRFIAWTVLLLGAAVLWPDAASAQFPEVPPPPVTVPWPFGRPRMDTGGIYGAAEFLWMKETNPLRQQPVAFRGVIDTDGTLGTALGIPSFPGNFIGSKEVALDVNSVSGPGTWEPGARVTLGYRFANGVAVEFSWLRLLDVKYAAIATFAPAGSIGVFGENSFLTSPVFNYSLQYAGPGNQTGQGSAIATLGVWNASSEQQISFLQRFEIYDINVRIPMQDSECWRTYGLIGPRHVIIWERFKWTTVTPEANGNTPPEDIAHYSNVVSNQLYGVHAGFGNEWMLGDTPAGAFSVSLDLQAALYFNFVRGIPKYELSDKSTSASHKRRWYTFVPELEGQLNVWWYPWEGIVVRLGYDAMGFFNTVASPQPIDFNMQSITPGYERTIFRLIDGFQFGFGIIF
jgi:hypothetical protein